METFTLAVQSEDDGTATQRLLRMPAKNAALEAAYLQVSTYLNTYQNTKQPRTPSPRAARRCAESVGVGTVPSQCVASRFQRAAGASRERLPPA